MDLSRTQKYWSIMCFTTKMLLPPKVTLLVEVRRWKKGEKRLGIWLCIMWILWGVGIIRQGFDLVMSTCPIAVREPQKKFKWVFFTLHFEAPNELFTQKSRKLHFSVLMWKQNGNAAFFRWWGVGVFLILDIFKGPRSNPLPFLVTSRSISLNGSQRQ